MNNIKHQVGDFKREMKLQKESDGNASNANTVNRDFLL